MKKISGDLSLMVLPDIMQWAEMNEKSGTLTLSCEKKSRRLYLEKGKLIFVSSLTEGERFGEFLYALNLIDENQLEKAINNSHKLNVSLTGYLISQKIIEKPILEKAITNFAESVITDVIQWEEASFEFIDEVPRAIINGPIKVNTTLLVFESARAIDESNKDKSEDTEKIINEINEKLKKGNIDMPPLPDMIGKINEAINKDAPVHDIAKIIMTDQILTAKILKVANSSFFSPASKITTLRHAAGYLGMKSIMSMITTHAISGVSAKHADKVKEIMQHSLLVALIARRIAQDLGISPDDVFVCGLLHDIGKTVLANIVYDYKLSEDDAQKVMQKYHQSAGYAMANEWNLSEVVKEVTRYHHKPELAKTNKQTVEIVYLANLIANYGSALKPSPESLKNLETPRIRLKHIVKELESMREKTEAMI